ncbi:MAG: hypothetical protein L3K09_01685 [Thermoplasmata archaeon]|nr:hypothetical protein [Thermoplasmata archaeon]
MVARSGTHRYLVELGYDGSGFAGWARQPGRRTVEGELRSAVVRLGLAASEEEAGIAIASRTDRGVNARGNAMTISSRLGPQELLRALHGVSEDIFFSRIATVPEEFRVRSALERRYRYWERPGSEVPALWKEAAALFRGTVDVRSFGRGLGTAGPVWRDFHSLGASSEADWVIVDLRAPSFVWGMVRKIISALRQLETGRLTVDRLASALRGERTISLPLAEPERLVLWEVSYPVPWTHHAAVRSRRTDPFHSLVVAAAARKEILARIRPGTSAP